MINVAVSACLLGEKIRFDAGHKQDRFITDELGRYCDFIPFCPEHLAYGTPRPSIRLIRSNSTVRVVTNNTKEDRTFELLKTSHAEINKLIDASLCGIIFKSKSPSCGLKSSKVYLDNGFCEGKEDGIFASMCIQQFPLLPMEEEGRLQDPWLRENFIMQLFAYDRFETFKANKPSIQDLVHFHTIHKFLLQSKDEKLYRELGRLVANQDHESFNNILLKYEFGFKTAIGKKSTIRKTRNVLEHLSGFFKNNLTTSEKEVLHSQIEDFSLKIVPLILPLSTIYLYAKKYDTAYLLDQVFLEPYPKTLALRSHIDAGK